MEGRKGERVNDITTATIINMQEPKNTTLATERRKGASLCIGGGGDG
jgi:hypothetical protein